MASAHAPSMHNSNMRTPVLRFKLATSKGVRMSNAACRSNVRRYIDAQPLHAFPHGNRTKIRAPLNLRLLVQLPTPLLLSL